MKKILLALTAITASICHAHTWHNTNGQSFEGELVAVSEDTVSIRRTDDGRLFEVPINVLTAGDQRYIRSSAIAMKAKLGEFAGFVGEWCNTDPDTRGITRVNITYHNESLKVHMWGRCHPIECDWGEATATIDEERNLLLVVWDQGFAIKEQRLNIRPNGELKVINRSEYTDDREPQKHSYIFSKDITYDWSDKEALHDASK